jgi:hypothetical protein
VSVLSDTHLHSDGRPHGLSASFQEIHQKWVTHTAPHSSKYRDIASVPSSPHPLSSVRLDVGISFHPVGQVPEEERKWAFELMKTCVKEYYVRGGWGWNDRDKWQELTDETSCFLLARDAVSGSLVGFVSFRFDLDEGVEVLYWWAKECQLCSMCFHACMSGYCLCHLMLWANPLPLSIHTLSLHVFFLYPGCCDNKSPT